MQLDICTLFTLFRAISEEKTPRAIPGAFEEFHICAVIFLSVDGTGHTAVSVADATDRNGISLDIFRQGHTTVACVA